MIVGGAAAHQSFTREVAASHLVSPSRLQVARQSYILEVSHIHLLIQKTLKVLSLLRPIVQ